MNKYDTCRGSFDKLGPGINESSVSVSVVADLNKPLTIELFSRADQKRLNSIHYPKEYRMGSVYSMAVQGLDPGSHLYRLKSGRHRLVNSALSILSHVHHDKS